MREAPEAAPSLRPPRSVREIASTLERAGYETWCVGGAVRDALLGHPHLDWDLATSATPDRVRALFRRTVPIGIEHGTVGVLDRDGVMHEVTTFRRDVHTDGRHAVVEFGASLDEDLARRDFTINAIAYSPRTEVVHDPFGGRSDLSAGLIRAVGLPEARMAEDRLRALRALRFAGRFGFRIENETWQAIVASTSFLPRLSRERVRQELEKTMDQVACPSRSLALWRSSGSLAVLVPAIADQPDAAFHAADFVGPPDATMREERASLRRLVRLATLFVGLAPRPAREALRGLRFSNRETETIAALCDAWSVIEAPMRSSLGVGAPTGAELRRWAAKTGRTAFATFLRVASARWSAARAAGESVPAAAVVHASYRTGVRTAYRDPVGVSDLAVDGSDLLTAGIPPGPLLGKVLTGLLDAVLDDPVLNERARLLEIAPVLHERLQVSGEGRR